MCTKSKEEQIRGIREDEGYVNEEYVQDCMYKIQDDALIQSPAW